MNSKNRATETSASVASVSGWGRHTTHQPKAEVVVTVVRIEEVAGGATGVDLVAAPGPAAQHTLSTCRLGIFPAIPAIVGVGLVKATGPFPDIAAEVGDALRAVATWKNTDWARAAQMAFKGVATKRFEGIPQAYTLGLPRPNNQRRRGRPRAAASHSASVGSR